MNYILGFIICSISAIIILNPDEPEIKYVNRKKMKSKNKRKKQNFTSSRVIRKNNSIISQKKFKALFIFLFGFIIMLVKF